MARYYKLDEVVDAVQFVGQDDPDLTINHEGQALWVDMRFARWLLKPGDALLVSKRLGEIYIVNPGCWILTDRQGNRYRMNDEDFRIQYAQFEEMVVTGETSDGYHTFDELYSHRHALFAVLLYDYQVLAWKTWKTADGRTTDGWFIAGIDTPWGQISYHMPAAWWERLKHVREIERNEDYDGHSSADVIERLWQVATFELEKEAAGGEA